MGDLSMLEAIGIATGVIAVILGGMGVVLKLAYNIGINNKILRDLVDSFEKLTCAERKEEINEVKADIVVMKSDIVLIKADIVAMKSDIVLIKADIVVIKADIVVMKSDIVVIKADIVVMKADIVIINMRLDSIEMTLASISSILFVIMNWIIKQDVAMIDTLSIGFPFFKRNSPKALNDFGHELIEVIDGMKFLEDHKDFLFDLIDKEKPKTALDVEFSAYSVCFISTGHDIFIPLKNIIYNASPIVVKSKNGENVDFNIDLSRACYVLSLPLRDMYLREHPEFLEI